MTTLLDDFLLIGGPHLPVSQAAERLGVSPRTIQRYRTTLRGGPQRQLPPGPRYRELAWTWLLDNPGSTAYEITRSALGKRGPELRGYAGSTHHLLVKMERDGQVTRTREYRPHAGRMADLWSAVEKCRRPGRCQPC